MYILRSANNLLIINLKNLSSSLIYIFTTIILNLTLIFIFNIAIRNAERNITLAFHQKLHDKSLKISAILNLINIYIATKDNFDNKIKNYSVKLQSNLNNAFKFNDMTIIREDGVVLFSSNYCATKDKLCAIASQDYFKEALKVASDRINIGKSFTNMLSSNQIMPFSKWVLPDNGNKKTIAIIGLDISKIIETINSKSYIIIIPEYSKSFANQNNTLRYFEFENSFSGNKQLLYTLKLSYNKEFYMTACSIFLPANLLLLFFVLVHIKLNSFRRHIFGYIKKIFPYEFMENNPTNLNDGLKILNGVKIQIVDYKDNLSKMSKAIGEIIKDYQLTNSEIYNLEQEVLTLLDDAEVNLNSEYRASICELSIEAKETAQISSIVLNLIRDALKEVIVGNREVTLEEIIDISKKDFIINCNIETNKTFYILKDLFLDKVDSIKQYMKSICQDSSLTMYITSNHSQATVLEFRGLVDKNKSKSNEMSVLNSLLHYKLRYLNTLNGIKYEVKDTEDQWIITIVLDPK